MENLGSKIKIIDNKTELTVDVKKMGLFKDLENYIELRLGDTLIFYLSKGDWYLIYLNIKLFFIYLK